MNESAYKIMVPTNAISNAHRQRKQRTQELLSGGVMNKPIVLADEIQNTQFQNQNFQEPQMNPQMQNHQFQSYSNSFQNQNQTQNTSQNMYQNPNAFQNQSQNSFQNVSQNPVPQPLFQNQNSFQPSPQRPFGSSLFRNPSPFGNRNDSSPFGNRNENSSFGSLFGNRFKRPESNKSNASSRHSRDSGRFRSSTKDFRRGEFSRSKFRTDKYGINVSDDDNEEERHHDSLTDERILKIVNEVCPSNMKHVIARAVEEKLRKLETRQRLPSNYDPTKHSFSENEMQLYDAQLERDKSKDKNRAETLISSAAATINMAFKFFKMDFIRTDNLPSIIRDSLKQGEFEDYVEDVGKYLRGTIFEDPIVGAGIKFLEKLGEANNESLEAENEQLEEELEQRQSKTNKKNLDDLNNLKTPNPLQGMKEPRKKQEIIQKESNDEVIKKDSSKKKELKKKKESNEKKKP